MRCKVCDQITSFLFDGMCRDCWSDMGLESRKDAGTIECQVYNYKCPNCKGKFNNPVPTFAPDNTIVGTYECPFCGRIMLGVKNG